MAFRLLGLTFVFVVCLSRPPLAWTLEGATREGVAFDETWEAEGTVLRIRGLGLLRYMVFVKVYVAALYLQPHVSSEETLSSVPKRLEISYLHPITAEEFARSTEAFITKNVTPEMLPQLRERMDRLKAWYQDVAPGDRYALTYLPGEGTELALNGEVKGVIPGSDFAAAVFSMWLGVDPVSESLKKELLGE